MNWKLTQNAIGEAQIDNFRDGEDLRRGFSLLRELARDNASLTEISPGVWSSRKRAEEREL